MPKEHVPMTHRLAACRHRIQSVLFHSHVLLVWSALLLLPDAAVAALGAARVRPVTRMILGLGRLMNGNDPLALLPRKAVVLRVVAEAEERVRPKGPQGAPLAPILAAVALVECTAAWSLSSLTCLVFDARAAPTGPCLVGRSAYGLSPLCPVMSPALAEVGRAGF